jgi:hypothetical protein
VLISIHVLLFGCQQGMMSLGAGTDLVVSNRLVSLGVDMLSLTASTYQVNIVLWAWLLYLWVNLKTLPDMFSSCVWTEIILRFLYHPFGVNYVWTNYFDHVYKMSLHNIFFKKSFLLQKIMQKWLLTQIRVIIDKIKKNIFN